MEGFQTGLQVYLHPLVKFMGAVWRHFKRGRLVHCGGGGFSVASHFADQVGVNRVLFGGLTLIMVPMGGVTVMSGNFLLAKFVKLLLLLSLHFLNIQ